MLQRHLAQAEELVTQGEQHVRAQRVHIVALERLGADCVEARQSLARFEVLQAMQVAHRDRLRREIAELDG